MRKRDNQPLTIYTENDGVFVGIKQWRMHNGSLCRHTKFYKPTKSSMDRIIKLAKTMQRHENEFYSNITMYYRYEALAVDVAITCANCGEYHSIYLPCKGGKREDAS